MKQLPGHRRNALLILAVTLAAAIAAYCIGFPIRNTPQGLQAAVEEAFVDHKGVKIAAGAEVVDTVRVGREMLLVCERGIQQGDVILHRGIFGGWRQVGGGWYYDEAWAESATLKDGKTDYTVIYGLHCPPEAVRYEVTQIFGELDDVLAQGEIRDGKVLDTHPGVGGMVNIWLYDAQGEELDWPQDTNTFGGTQRSSDVKNVYVVMEIILAIGGLKAWFLWRKKPEKSAEAAK